MNAEKIELTEEEFEDYLNEVYGDVDICGISYPAGNVLKQVDETAFDVAYADHDTERWKCGECGAEYDNEEGAEDCCSEEEEEPEEEPTKP
jgi:hypothetical protein